ncbi:YNL122C [Zygosaccharomyces parabailii]|uniref:50S ribosomal protein L35 n=1 Tax=Zygosaccharomyces bailii (strain CLIB 213 / ATCC 58445 / CBS 680 / BCRC 21525 / NBRC 1098 / NCYC 1416 / NRRL Y-2227) TaxID=1333698 RepID=A0A8J2TAS1_ZYGB2|nr:YNL122C [Zygosaccharomyces parabailii]CDF91508.1 ZYBA0S12-00518g1_1 [Zygosaccharomyces bailii CLIB 213]SJM86543.1 related to Putative mitochondrial ribosomal protein YNL122C [Zygosaccharomyces bailii]
MLSTFFPRLGPSAGLGGMIRFNNPSLIFTRHLMKTHKGAAKRWKKTANGFKRGKAGRSHGNVGWSRRSLKVLSGKTTAHETHLQRLRRLLPY